MENLNLNISNYNLHTIFGAHIKIKKEIVGTQFTVFAPNAKKVSVVGNFNHWNFDKNPMTRISAQGIWSLFIPNILQGEIYKYKILTKENQLIIKSDPFAFFSQIRPHTSSIVYDIFNDFLWSDDKWIKKRELRNIYKSPISIYEIHLGSWKKNDTCFLNYREIAKFLIPYLLELNFTHVEFLPLTEHPLDDSWGYQGVSYFSITSRYGSPQDFKYLINELHLAGIGVILDWVPGHFCKDSHGLYHFDGKPLFEYTNNTLKENPLWGTANFNLKNNFVKNFLISNLIFLFETFHIDGVRVDAVSNLIYLEYEKEKTGLTNELGSDTNLDAINFLKEMNEAIFKRYSTPLIIAEEATSWPSVTKPTYMGGLGFNFKWNMGWMNDILKYMSLSPKDKVNSSNLLTFSLMYSFNENFILPLSHDEVVHEKKSLLDKMYGTYIEKFDSLRMFYGFMFAHPGKKLIFMGGEIGQFVEWRFYEELEWKLLKFPQHDSIKTYLSHLNLFYKNESALWENDFSSEGFQWINHQAHKNKVITFIRKGEHKNNFLIIVCNFTTNQYVNHCIGIPRMTKYIEVFNSDKDIYGGNNCLNNEIILPLNKEIDNQPFSISINVAPLSTIFFKPIFLKEE